MTHDTDTLERDLALLSEPDEAFRAELRTLLAERAAPPVRRQRRTLRLGLATGALAATAAAAVLVLVSGGGSGRPQPADAAIIRHARSALTPPAGSILHEKLVDSRAGVGAESWALTGPPYARRDLKGPLGSQFDQADDGTTESLYIPSSNTIYQRPSSAPPAATDPLAAVRDSLRDGQARVTGQAVVDGTEAYRIVLSNGLSGYFAKADYRPLRIVDPQRDGSIVTLDVVDFRYLPATSANKRSLNLTAAHPDARIDHNPADWPPGAK